MSSVSDPVLSNIVDNESCILEQVTLGPREGARVPLGIYEVDMPEPDFHVGCSHGDLKNSDIEAALERIDKDDEYQLVYFFQNFTDKTYNIIVRELCT